MNIFMSRRVIGLSLLLAFSVCLRAEQPAHTPLAFKDPLQDKNYYLLSTIEWTPAARAAVKSNSDLAAISAEKRAAVANAANICATDVACYSRALRWSDDEIAKSRAAFVAIGSDPELKKLIDGPLARSGMYQQYADRAPGEFFGQIWEDAAHKMNDTIDVYGLGLPPTRNNIFGTYATNEPEFARNVKFIVGVLNYEAPSLDLFFQPTMRFADDLLHAQRRDEAGRNEPLEQKENKAAYQRLHTINWSQFPYTLILVLGQGPDIGGISISPLGWMKTREAVKAYREGKAPFILVSGGYVHPALTPYSEALEMKKALMTEFGIPEDAIIVDPQARSTVTNFRNAVRLMYRYNIPFDRKALVVADQVQIDGLGRNPNRANTNPSANTVSYHAGERLSPFRMEFTPVVTALNVSTSDMLDP